MSAKLRHSIFWHCWDHIVKVVCSFITEGPVVNDFGAGKCPLGYKFNLQSQVCDGKWKSIAAHKLRYFRGSCKKLRVFKLHCFNKK